MKEVRKESLSALIDGEASEIEVHRLVREFRSDDDLTQSWVTFQSIRTAARAEKDPLTEDHHHQLFARISAAIDEEENHASAPVASQGSRKTLYGSLAVAASLVVAVLVGVQQTGLNETTNPLVAGQPSVVSAPVTTFQPGSLQSGPIQTSTVSTLPGAQVNLAAGAEPFAESSELVALDEEKQRLLRQYLYQHDRMSRMNPDKQFVNFQENTRN